MFEIYICSNKVSPEFEQLLWLNPDINHELLWDYGMCADTSRGAAVRDLIAKALKGPLVPVQQEVPHVSGLLVLQPFGNACLLNIET